MYSEVATGLETPAGAVAAIAAFAVNAGWTLLSNTLTGSVRTAELQRSGDVVRLWNDAGNIFVRTIAGGAAAPFYAQANIGAGPYAKLYCFADTLPAEHVHVVVEMMAGVVRLVTFGELEKTGAAAMGTYFDATYWVEGSSYRGYYAYNHHVPFSDLGDQCGGLALATDAGGAWATFYANSNNPTALMTGLRPGYGTDAQAWIANQVSLDANPHNNRRIGRPLLILAARAGGYRSPIGYAPNIRCIRIDPFNFGDELPDADGSTWKIFPFARKGPRVTSGASEDSSENFGYAIRKVT